MVGVVGLTIYAGSVFIIVQCIFVYIPLSYPQYAASLFAGNDFCRSAFAFGSVLYGRAMYVNLGVGKGVSLLAGLSVLGIIGMFLLYFYGAKLRARSKFAIA
jgi:DHA1 family multidrug resistance protein-like MFS transporter